jgi:hypothetical protein
MRASSSARRFLTPASLREQDLADCHGGGLLLLAEEHGFDAKRGVVEPESTRHGPDERPFAKPGQVELVPLHWRPFLVVGESGSDPQVDLAIAGQLDQLVPPGQERGFKRNAVERFAGGQPGLGQGCRDDLPGSRQGLIPVLHLAEVSAQRVSGLPMRRGDDALPAAG